MAERQREYLPVNFSLLFKHTHAIPYHKTMAEIFDVLYNVCLLKTYSSHNKFTVVYQITMRAKALFIPIGQYTLHVLENSRRSQSN